jgi:glycosyltransferase involved in cell wall biosynthesis
MQTHAFFWREISELRKLGARVELYSTKAPPAGVSKHAFTAQAIAQTHYVYPPRWTSMLRLLQSPVGTIRGAKYALSLRNASWRTRLATLALLPCAGELARNAEHKGITHMHIHSCANAVHLGTMVKHLSGIPFSATLHGDLPVYGSNHVEKLRLAKFVIAVTKPLAVQLEAEAQVPRDRIQVCWMGVDTDRFQPGVRTTPGTTLKMVTVARLNRAKGHVHALRAMKRVLESQQAIHYTIVGEGPERAHIEAEIQSLGLQAHVTLTGTQSEDEVLAILQQSDVFLLPSVGKGEASPVSVMEAMSCGLPVVCSIIGGTPDLITDGHDGFLTAMGDEAAIATRLTQLAQNGELRASLSAHARQRAKESFTAVAGARKLLNWIDNPM